MIDTIIGFIILGTIYFSPTIIASSSNIRQGRSDKIYAVNLLTDWNIVAGYFQ
jgi:hypothetical protein